MNAHNRKIYDMLLHLACQSSNLALEMDSNSAVDDGMARDLRGTCEAMVALLGARDDTQHKQELRRAQEDLRIARQRLKYATGPLPEKCLVCHEWALSVPGAVCSACGADPRL